jgi:hypothetical protein
MAMNGGLPRATDGSLSVTLDATGARWSGGLLLSPDDKLVVTSNATGAVMSGGNLRAPNGALVIDEVSNGSFQNGQLRAPNGALIVTRDHSVLNQLGGLVRDFNGKLVVEGLAPVQAAYPSRVKVVNHALVDVNGFDVGVLKGFNTNVASTVGGENFAFSQADYTAMSTLTNGASVAGPGINRLVCHWDVFEQSAGVIHGLSNQNDPLSAATAGSALASLDTSIQRAYAAGRYVVLDLPHLNVGRIPAWVPATAAAGTPLAGQTNELARYAASGQNLTQKIAARYANPATSPIGAAAGAVIGGFPNESPTVPMADIMTAFETICGWYRAVAPAWPIWIAPTAFGNGTPYPSSAPAINTTRLLALDTNNVGIICAWNTYLIKTGTGGFTYQGNGSIAPIQQIPTTGAHFFGWGDADFVYPDTAAARTVLANHIAPLSTLRAVDSRIAIAITEFGSDRATDTSHDAWVRDTVNTFRGVGAVAEIWWQYGTTPTNVFDSGSTTGGGFRAGISGAPWMGNATARA